MMIPDSIFTLLGIALCLFALLQLGLWSAQSLFHMGHNRKQFLLSQQALRAQITQGVRDDSELHDGSWKGFRWFVVDRLVKETQTCTSVYLKPEDGKQIVGYRPGQHLTFRFDVPGESKPVVRCYSLSQASGQDCYRISVKEMSPPRDKPELPSGKASYYINNVLMPGDRISVKAPSGSFYLKENTNCPVVMLAGGIGITPMIGMIEHLIQTQSDQLAILIYGSRNGTDHAFKNYLAEVSARHQNLHVVNVYSEPLPNEKEGADYHQSGFISMDLIKRLLPNNRCHFYMCGPPPFMSAIYEGLMEWQVPDTRIFFEAFGPASIKKKAVSTTSEAPVSASVAFAKSGSTVAWSEESQSILDLAEASGVEIDSGCRAGSCGSCETELIKGKVCYPDGDPDECKPGHCLVCIARPDGNIELNV